MGLITLIKRWQYQRKQERYNKLKAILLKGRIFQFFESYEIIYTTKNLKTIESRINFINSFYDELINNQHNIYYKQSINWARIDYAKCYPKCILKKLQLSLVVNPNHTQLNNFYAGCIVVCFDKYAKEQQTSIQKLQRTTAINKRKEDVVNRGYEAKGLLNVLEVHLSSECYQAIEQIISKF